MTMILIDFLNPQDSDELPIIYFSRPLTAGGFSAPLVSGKAPAVTDDARTARC